MISERDLNDWGNGAPEVPLTDTGMQHALPDSLTPGAPYWALAMPSFAFTQTPHVGS